MKYSVENQPVFTSLKVELDQGETIRAEAGAMISMSPTIELATKTTGKGLGGILKSAIGGEGLFQSTYTATSAGEVILAPPTPGDILPIEMSGKTILAQSGAYLAGSETLELSTQGSFRAMVSGEGLFLQKVTGTGTLFLSSFGAIYEKELAGGETYVIDTGNMMAYEEGVSVSIKKAAKGLFATVASGEGLVAHFTGPGKVWIQTRNLPGFASVIAKLTATSK